MIYVDTSVVLARLLAEDREPGAAFWAEDLISSRLVQYEVWNRIHGQGLESTHGEAVRAILVKLSLVELSPVVLDRALDLFPIRVRTLDALHLASMEYLRSLGHEPSLASYDSRMNSAAGRMRIALYDLG